MEWPLVDVVEARYVSGYTLWVRFEDGVEGEVDFSDDLHGGVFEPLRDVELFKRFSVEGGTVEWPTGASPAQVYLYERVRRSASRPTRPV